MESTSASAATMSNDVVETTNDRSYERGGAKDADGGRPRRWLCITPRASGVLRVKGVAWTVGEKGICETTIFRRRRRERVEVRTANGCETASTSV